MSKQILFADSARQRMLRGVEKLADAVAVTMGPRGRNVIINKAYGGPSVTKDGATVAQEIELEDPFENMGAQLVKEVSVKTNDAAGDGTTTATVLAQALINEGMKNVAAGANPMVVKRGIKLAVDKAVETVVANSKAVAGSEYTEDELNAIRALARDAQFYWDFVFVENSEGAHNSALSKECLNKAEMLLNQAMGLFKPQEG